MKCSSHRGNYGATWEFCFGGCELQDSPAQVCRSNLCSQESQCGHQNSSCTSGSVLGEKETSNRVYTHSLKPPLEVAAGNATAGTVQPGSSVHHYGRAGRCVPDPHRKDEGYASSPSSEAQVVAVNHTLFLQPREGKHDMDKEALCLPGNTRGPLQPD